MAQGPNVTQGATFCLVMVQIVISLHDYVRITVFIMSKMVLIFDNVAGPQC